MNSKVNRFLATGLFGLSLLAAGCSARGDVDVNQRDSTWGDVDGRAASGAVRGEVVVPRRRRHPAIGRDAAFGIGETDRM